MKTHLSTPAELQKSQKWYHIDATGHTLGRLATRLAFMLRGKHKPTFMPHQITGDLIVVTNASKIKVSGNKLVSKVYHHYSGYPGGLKSENLGSLLTRKPEDVIWLAVKGMLPKNATGRNLMKRLKIYAGADHPHTAQNPETYTFED